MGNIAFSKDFPDKQAKCNGSRLYLSKSVACFVLRFNMAVIVSFDVFGLYAA
jgi:hypothetical protein